MFVGKRELVLDLVLLEMLPNSGTTSNFEFLNLMYESSILENQAIWIIGIHVKLVWEHVICKKKILKLETLLVS